MYNTYVHMLYDVSDTTYLPRGHVYRYVRKCMYKNECKFVYIYIYVYKYVK